MLLTDWSRRTILAALVFATVPANAGKNGAPPSAPLPSPCGDLHGARVSPDGAWVIYAAEQEEPGVVALYRVPLEGGSDPVLLGGPLSSASGYRWTISPDGRRVVYVGDGLFSVSIDGRSSPVQLDDPLASGAPRDYVLTPDGARVVYRAAPPGKYLGLFSVPTDGSSRPVEIVAPNDLGDAGNSCRISADGRAVVFTSLHGGLPSARLYSAPVAGGSVVPLTRPRFAVQDFQISPDGAHVVYRGSPVRQRTLALYHAAIDGGLEPFRLSGPLLPGKSVQDYAIAADGVRVVYLADQGDGRSELLSVPMDGSSPALSLARDAALSFQLQPDARLVLFKSDRGQSENFTLEGVAIDGSAGPLEISAPLTPHGHVGWFGVTPDGSRIVYQAYRGADSADLASELWQVAASPGSSATKLADAEAAEGFQFSADGKRLLYQDGNAALLSLALDGGAAPAELEPASVEREFEICPDGGRVVYSVSARRAARRGKVGPVGGLFSRRADGSRAQVRLYPPASRFAPTAPAPGGSIQTATTDGVGFRDFSFGLTGTSTPSGEKPECKLWWNDGSWWGSLYNDALQDYHIGRLDFASQTWSDTGTVLDDRTSSKADVLWDGATRKLYVASHIFTTNAQPTASNWGRLFRYTYDPATKVYTRDVGFPVDITRGNAEALTIAKDSQGRLWATWTEASKVMVNHSIAGDAQWGLPFVLPANPTSVSLTPDDISAIIAFGGSNVGIMWSNQVTFNTYFAVHRDVDADTVWREEEVVIPDANCTGQCSDDLFNLKTDASGRVFVSLKTSLIGPDEALELVTVRGPTGGWTSTVFGRVRDHHSRPILLLDEQNAQVYVFATSPENSGAIYMKTAPISNIQFAPGLGTPFIQNSTDVTINNATSTKQNLNNQTDLVVLASDQNTRFYLHNVIELGPPLNPPTIASFTPTSGPVGTAVTVTGTNFTGTTSVRFNGTAAAFTVVSSTQINTAVPSGATTGKISVATPDGSATSAGDFTVPAPNGPSITSFTPTSGPVGTAVTVTGTNFTGATGVRFNGTAAAFTVASATQINATVPAAATTGKISVTTPNGTGTSAGDFNVTSPPTITSFTPTSGPSGTAVTITGTSFTGATSVRFNGLGSAFTVASGTQINATVPSGATTGKVSVTTPDGTGTSTGDFTVTHPPVITSFTPTSGPVGAAVTISGGNFVGTTSVRFNGTVAAFTVVSGTQIDATVPSGATTGKISATSPEGTGTSTGDFTVTLPNGPTITSFTPASGPVGTAVSITGTNFTGTTSVRFNGTAAAFTVASPTQINATVPAAATSGKISVTTPDGTATSAGDFTVTHPPMITSFTPASGPVGTAVTITGANFTGTTSVRFNGTAAAFTVASPTQINATVPAAATSGKISVTTPDGTATSAGDFTVTHPPMITSFTPASGPVGTAVTITGANFTGTTSVRFNGTAAAFTVASATQINATVPSGATTGKITVATPEGTGTSADDFTVTLPNVPTITSFAPTSGPVGTAVTITGSNFLGATNVRFNGTAAIFAIASASQINATVPPGATTGKISVTTPDGTATSVGDFTVTNPPTITSFTPTSGPVGTAVAITGTNFTGTTSVRFNGTSAAFSVASSTQINATVPSGATSGKVSLTTPDGSATSTGDFSITNPPSITAFTPTSGPVGASVTITGNNFTGATSVRFNGTLAVFSVASISQINATVPSGATSGKISVTTPDGTTTSAGDFAVTHPPTIASFTPTSGPVGTAVAITGTNFTGTTSVRFNGTSAVFSVASISQINATVPSGATSGKISVTTPDGTATSAGDFSITNPPSITAFTPTSGPVGASVTITGNNFTGATSVRFNGTLAAFSVASISQINATVPSGATSGKISVTTPDGTATSAGDFSVTHPPTIASFTPTTGPVGTAVTISGTNFTGTTSVRFNGTAAAFVVATNALITTTVPSGASSGKISVTTSDGTATSTGDFTVTSPPVILSFTPSSGPVGALVAITGLNFTGTTSVRFNGTSAAFSVASSTQINATVPAGATSGKISVTTPDGTATSIGDFSITNPPSITSFTPTSGPVGASVTITGNNFTGATSVRFNGTLAVFSVASSSQINATVPSGATTGKISVTTPDGTATSAGDFAVTHPPTITSFTPTSGPVGTEVTITGTNFTGATSVRFNGTSAVFSVASSTQINATVPSGATSGKISVTTPDGTATSAGDFAVTHPPTLTSFTPTSGPVGTVVAITGSNFTGTTSVRFNGTEATFLVATSVLITTTVPAGATTGQISVTTPDGTATSAGSFSVTNPPVILSFSPSSGPTGTLLAITGSNFTGTTSVRFNGVSAAFSVSSSTRIDATVPSGATTGKISVTTPDGSATSSADFGVTHPPTIASFTPTLGPVGTSVAITGANFTGTTSVRFNGASAAFSVSSSIRIDATVPSGATTGEISVTTPDGTATSIFDFIVTHPPTIGAFTPTLGPVGTSVAITGTNFNGTTSVRFNGASAAFNVASSTRIDATVPSGATSGRVSVTTPDGSATSSADFGVTHPPTFASFTPTLGPVGTSVAITGTNFNGTTSVRFNGASAAFNVASSTRIDATVPSGATSGRISVTTPDGSATSSADFGVTHPPTIASFTPTSGPIGTPVAITGANFSGTTRVKFNGTDAAFLVSSSTLISTTVPQGAVTGKISVTNPDGTATSSGDFHVTQLPTIGSFTPTSGPVGTRVTITGTNFSGTTKVRFNGTDAGFTVTSSTVIATTVPSGAGTGKITVSTGEGSATSSGSFTVTSSAPTIGSFTPTSGPVGTRVTITGANFSGTTKVRFNGTDAGFTVTSSTVIATTVPPGASTGKISVTTGAGSATSSASFTVTSSAPTITSFTPTSGRVGTLVTITGTNFSGTTKVRFEDRDAGFTVTSSTVIATTVPSDARSGRITVITREGSTTSSGSFTVTSSGPTIASFTPTSGLVGTPVVITGSGFSGVTKVRFNDRDAIFTVTLGTLIATSVPIGATSGKITVTTQGGTATSAGNFTVLGGGLLSINSLAPSSGTPGTKVTITGSGFTDVKKVRFHGRDAAFTVLSSTQILATVPDQAESGAITVTTRDASTTSSAEFSVTLDALKLWPPNHKYVELDMSRLLGADEGPIEITGITQDEPVDEDGDEECDGYSTGSGIAYIRAERSGSGNGRVYQIHYTSSGSGHSDVFIVTVPHDQGGGSTVDDGQRYNSGENCH